MAFSSTRWSYLGRPWANLVQSQARQAPLLLNLAALFSAAASSWGSCQYFH